MCALPQTWGATTGCQSVAVQTAGHRARSHARTRFTCGVAVQDPRHDHHFVRPGALARQHDTGCKDGDEAVADHGLFPDGGTQSHRDLWNTVLRATRLPPFYSPAQPARDKLDTEGAEDPADGVHGNNQGPDHGDGLRRRLLFVSVEPAAVDEALYELQ